jgi:hypothetical protein
VSAESTAAQACRRPTSGLRNHGCVQAADTIASRLVPGSYNHDEVWPHRWPGTNGRLSWRILTACPATQIFAAMYRTDFSDATSPYSALCLIYVPHGSVSPHCFRCSGGLVLLSATSLISFFLPPTFLFLLSPSFVCHPQARKLVCSPCFNTQLLALEHCRRIHSPKEQLKAAHHVWRRVSRDTSVLELPLLPHPP